MLNANYHCNQVVNKFLITNTRILPTHRCICMCNHFFVVFMVLNMQLIQTSQDRGMLNLFLLFCFESFSFFPETGWFQNVLRDHSYSNELGCGWK